MITLAIVAVKIAHNDSQHFLEIFDAQKGVFITDAQNNLATKLLIWRLSEQE